MYAVGLSYAGARASGFGRVTVEDPYTPAKHVFLFEAAKQGNETILFQEAASHPNLVIERYPVLAALPTILHTVTLSL